MAFRKLTGMKRTFEAGEEVFRRLARGQGRFRVRYPGHGRHVEADIGRQVLALIDHGKPVRIYPISSGAPVTPTILGSFRVYMKTPGTNAKGMVHSSYFIRGYAIHGYASVPPYPASHGCLRVPIPEAASIFAWVRHGTRSTRTTAEVQRPRDERRPTATQRGPGCSARGSPARRRSTARRAPPARRAAPRCCRPR